MDLAEEIRLTYDATEKLVETNHFPPTTFHTLVKRLKGKARINVKGCGEMGYILPVQPTQGELYANRMNAVRNNFAYVDRVEKVKMDPDLMDKFEDSLRSEQERMMEEEEPKIVQSRPPYLKGFIYPNPANLSPDIAHLVGKGLAVNEYV